MSRILEIAKQCLKEESQAVLNLTDRLNSDFETAAEMILKCKGKVVVTGVGKSGHIGRKIAATLASTGTPAFFLNPLDAYHGDLGMLSPNDIVLAISYSGTTDELLRIIPLLQRRSIPIISITGDIQSLLARYSTIALDASVEHEADPLNLAPTSSTTTSLALGDAIACALIKARGFKATDFAQFHPGGSLGKRLLAQVKDYMITKNLPIVYKNDKICDTIFEISKNKQGIVVVLENNNIIGVVTDGDVRRAMQNNRNDFFELQVEQIMSRHPKVVHGNDKIEHAAEIMRKYNIHSLIVVNNDNQLIGIIDYFACQI